MSDRQVSIGCVIAVAMWVVTVLLMVAGLVVFDYSQHAGLGCWSFGLAFSAGSATVTIRAFFARQNELLRNAFELGRDSGSTVRRMPAQR